MTDHLGIVGAWYYDAVGAPFPPHVAVFHADGTVMSSNPDRGETNNSASAGMGVWAKHDKFDDPRRHVTGRFVEVNADPTSHAHTSNLIVDFTVTIAGDTFEGPATARVYAPDGTLVDGPFPATLKGQRVTLHTTAPVAAD